MTINGLVLNLGVVLKTNYTFEFDFVCSTQKSLSGLHECLECLSD